MAKTAVIFHSRFTEHELVRRPRDEEPLRGGGWRTTQTRIAYQFHAAPAPDGLGGLIGVLEVQPGKDRMADHNGWLKDGQDETAERDAVAALRAHRQYGFDFWEAGHAPGTLYPRPVDWRRDVMSAGVGLDEETLVRMIGEERGLHARPELMTFAEETLAVVRDNLAQIAATQEAEAAKAAKAKPKAAAPA